MKPNKNFEWVFHKNQLTLVSSTLHNNKNFSYKHENLFYHIWDPYSSKLAAAIFNGLEMNLEQAVLAYQYTVDSKKTASCIRGSYIITSIPFAFILFKIPQMHSLTL